MKTPVTGDRTARFSGRHHCRGVTILETLIAMSMSMVMLTSMVILYVGAAKSSAREDNTLTVMDEQRLVNDRLTREVKMMGMIAPLDANGDSNDIDRDVPDFVWSDSLFEDIEHANTYNLVVCADIDGDDRTETVDYYLSGNEIYQRTWEWSRDSSEWVEMGARQLASSVDHLMFIYYDSNGDPIPNSDVFPEGGFTLSRGERARVTALEMILVTHSDRERNGRPEMTYLPDGTYFYDNFERVVQRFLIQGRNLRVGA